MQILKSIILLLMAVLLVSCGGGGSSSTPAVASAAPSGSAPAVTQVAISGKISFDKVPHKASGFGLDYSNIENTPARGIIVVMLGADNEVLAQTLTNENGEYSFAAKPSIDVRVQARAAMISPDNTSWDVAVTDNTLDNAMFAMNGALTTTGTSARQTRDLHANSGWNQGQYSAERVAAPFAILSPVYDAIKAIETVDKDAIFPALEIRWSPNNRPVVGSKSAGHIGTSGYHHDENVIYLLGEAGRDTDEYDPHVIIHEWGHYFEDHLSRLDSMGGLHGLGEKLDPRLAFSEGFGNALAAIITGDPNYKDSSGESQDNGFEIDFENLTTRQSGWYNEGSVAAIIYDVFDQNVDGNDRINAGLAPIYGAMTDEGLRGADVFMTMFSFSDALLKQPSINSADFGLLLDGQNISASNALATGEQNNGAIASALPVYKEVTVNGDAVEVCSVDDAGNFNKLGNREFVFFNIPADGHYEIKMTLSSGDDQRDPDFNLWQGGDIKIEAASSRKGEESFAGNMTAGDYVAEAYDFYNINGTSDKRGDGCFMVSLTG